MGKLKILTKSDIASKLSVFVYGMSGSGKTFLASTLLNDEDLLPALVLVCDGSELTLKKYMSEVKHVGINVMQADLDSIEDAYDDLTDPKNKYKTVFLDNITALHRICLENQAKKGSTGKARTEYEYTMQDYGIARAQVLTILDRFLALPTSLITTCWASANIEEGSGKRTIDPNLSGKLAFEIPGMFNVCGYLYNKEASANEQAKAKLQGKVIPGVRSLLVSATKEIPAAKDRSGLLGTEVLNPTIPMIKQLLNG